MRHLKTLFFAGALGASLLAATAFAGTINIGGESVQVPKGGLYDRFQSNPPLSVIANEHPDIDLSWFRTLSKEKVDIGFESYSPNFYYRSSRISAVFTADSSALEALLPAAVRSEVQPLKILPGRGLVVITAYTYDVCDNDRYNEIAISVVTQRQGSWNLGPISLLQQALSKDFSGYVALLPVDTDVARARGVVGYGLPKWTTPIDTPLDQANVRYVIANQATGKTDLELRGRRLAEVSDREVFVTNRFTNLNARSELSHGYAVARQLRHGSSMNPSTFEMVLGSGPLSDLLRSLDLGRMLRYEYVPEFQAALYAPKPLAHRR